MIHLVCFFRDVVKAIHSFAMQLASRLFYIKREYPSSVNFSAILDIIPQAKHHKKNVLTVKKGASIERWCVVNTWHGDVVLEDGAGIGIGSIIIGPVRFGRRSRCSQNCFIAGESHYYQDISKDFLSQGNEIKPVEIEENVWIGSNCVILPGVRIGKHSIIGAGTVVTRDVPSYSVMVGTPARLIKKYDFEKKDWIKA